MQHPLMQYLKDAEKTMADLQDVQGRMQLALHDSTVTKTALKDAEDALKEAEATVVAELTMAAMAKQGPLAGVATSSKAYASIVDAELVKARAGNLSRLDIAVKRATAAAEQCSIELAQAQAQFSAVRHMADLQSAMLNAASAYSKR